MEIVGHVTGAELLRAEAARPWSIPYLRAEMLCNRRLGPSFRARALAVDSWDELTVLPSTRVFTDEVELFTGVLVRHVGGRHAPDSSVVVVPDSEVMLLGDSWYPPPLHLRIPEDEPDLALVERLLDDGIGWYVSSHRPPMTLAAARTAIAR